MASILIITRELAGRVNTFCELGRRLRDAGHDIVVTSPADIGERVRARGLEFRALSRLHPPGYAGEAVIRVSPTRALQSLWDLRHFRRNRAAALDEQDVSGWIDGLGTMAPDLVLCDFELPVQVALAKGLGLRVGLLSDQLSLYKQPGLPPLHRNVAPGEGWRGSRIGREMLWGQFRAWKWVRFQLLRLLSGGRDELSVLRATARRIGLDLRNEAQLYQWSIPVTWKTLPVMILNALELEFPHSPPPNVVYVGPVLDRRPVDDAAESAPLETLLAGSTERRLIYGGFGAYHEGDESNFLERVVAAVAGEPLWDLVVGLGGRTSPEALGPIPRNVHVLAWAPQQRLLAHADAAVLHGGITSVNEAISAGVPMVVYPHDYNDTPGSAARIRYHGLGVTGDRTAVSAEDIHAHITDALSDPGIRSNVERMRAHFESYGDRAVEAVDDLLR